MYIYILVYNIYIYIIYVIHDSLNTKNIAGFLGIVHMFFSSRARQVVDPPRAGLDPVTLEAVSGRSADP